VSGFDFPIRRASEGPEKDVVVIPDQNDHDVKDSKMDLLDGDAIVCCNNDVGGIDVPRGRVV